MSKLSGFLGEVSSSASPVSTVAPVNYSQALSTVGSLVEKGVTQYQTNKFQEELDELSIEDLSVEEKQELNSTESYLASLDAKARRSNKTDDMRIRAEALLKKKMTQWPALADHFKRISHNKLGFNAIGESLRQREAAQKAALVDARQRRNAILQDAQNWGITNAEMNTDEGMKAYESIKRKQRNYENLKIDNQIAKIKYEMLNREDVQASTELARLASDQENIDTLNKASIRQQKNKVNIKVDEDVMLTRQQMQHTMRSIYDQFGIDIDERTGIPLTESLVKTGPDTLNAIKDQIKTLRDRDVKEFLDAGDIYQYDSEYLEDVRSKIAAPWDGLLASFDSKNITESVNNFVTGAKMQAVADIALTAEAEQAFQLSFFNQQQPEFFINLLNEIAKPSPDLEAVGTSLGEEGAPVKDLLEGISASVNALVENKEDIPTVDLESIANSMQTLAESFVSGAPISAKSMRGYIEALAQEGAGTYLDLTKRYSEDALPYIEEAIVEYTTDLARKAANEVVIAQQKFARTTGGRAQGRLSSQREKQLPFQVDVDEQGVVKLVFKEGFEAPSAAPGRKEPMVTSKLRAINRGYMKRINDAIKAFSNMDDKLSTREAALDLLQATGWIEEDSE